MYWSFGCLQWCWAHLKRDFQKLVDRGGESKDIGEMGLGAVEVVFPLRHAFRGGGMSRGQLQRQIVLIRQTLREWLEQMWASSLYRLKIRAEMEDARRGPKPHKKRRPRK